MELSRNKIIFFTIGGVLAFFLILILLIMFFSGNQKKKSVSTNGDFVIWTVGDNLVDPLDFVNGFKKYSGTQKGVIFESFDNYEDYSLALTYALASGNGPDVFVLNNNEKNSVFENQVLGISPSVVNPDFVRKQYKSFVSEQMIYKNEKNLDFLIGLPVGYETLGIFYNKEFVNLSDLDSFSSINSAISRLKEKDSTYIPLAIGNGTTIDYSEDIITQFMLSVSGERDISNISRKSVQIGLANYLNFGDESSENAYNSRYKEMKVANQKGVDLFIKGDSFMLIGYPRFINEIVKNAKFSSSRLLATKLPNDSSSKATLVNYNYFVINKDTDKLKMAEKFMSYISSEQGIAKYHDVFPYYLPVVNIFEKNIDSQKIHPNYNIKIGDFYDEDANYTSFNKGLRNIYDSKVRDILDKEDGNIEEFLSFQKYLNCKTNKIIKQTDFSKSCE